MKAINSASLVSKGGILTALAVLLQSSPVFLPGAGMMLSPFSTLPVALAASMSVYAGILTLLSSAALLLLISPQEAIIFLSATGPLGLALGAFYKKGTISTIAAAGATLFIGINILIHAAGIAAFGGLTPDSSLVFSTLIYLIFSFIYSAFWVLILKLFSRFLKRTGQSSLFNL